MSADDAVMRVLHKAKRLAHTSRVTLQPCDARGKLTAGTAPVDAEAVLVTGPQLDEIRRKIVDKYGFMTKVTKLLAELTAYSVMRTLHDMAQVRVRGLKL